MTADRDPVPPAPTTSPHTAATAAGLAGPPRTETGHRGAAPPESRQSRLDTLALADPTVLVLADAGTTAGRSNAKGHLFERFVAHLLASYGFEDPIRERLNVTVDGIELDVRARHKLTNHLALAECKAYSSAVRSELLAAFYGKLVLRRYDEPGIHGFFVAIPRLTSDGRQQAEAISRHDKNFSIISAVEIETALKDIGEITDLPSPVALSSDPAVVITEHGVYSACVELDENTRTPSRILVWAPNRPVPTPVIEALAAHEYAQGTRVEDANVAPDSGSQERVATELDVGVIVQVLGSQSDFEYQLPASPRFFIGRQKLVNTFEELIDVPRPVIVLNAQSGWGKSSLALRLKDVIEKRGGYALVVDSRTASSPRFVTEVLRRAAIDAQRVGLLEIPADASWASLASALRTIGEAEWRGSVPLMIFFDQFENVFHSESLTREFRDLALGAQEHAGRLLVGFAWKTDLVGWTEAHPYWLRDEIRGTAEVLTLDPLGAPDVELLLRRLERELGQKLARELRQRLREYSQGLPWLLKKLAGHLLREVRQGATQEQLVSEALNVQNLFDADLAELGPGEQEGLRYVARFAPIAVGEVLERVSPAIVQSLLDRRLLVQVGERLDTYWDIFRDYLNTGRIPVEDSYIIRMSPASVSRLLRQVVEHNGDMPVPQIAAELNTSENTVFNLSRELRLLGVAGLEPNRVRIVPEIWDADDREVALRQRVAAALRRHRAFSAFTGLAERSGSKVAVGSYARELPSVFPAVEVSANTWQAYARAFLAWFEYAGLGVRRGATWALAGEPGENATRLLGVKLPRRLRSAFPQEPAGPSLRLLERLGSMPDHKITGPLDSAAQEAARPLFALRAISLTPDGGLELVRLDLILDGKVSPVTLFELMRELATNRQALALIERDPTAKAQDLGLAIRLACGAEWAPTTTELVGKHFRSWARAAGVEVRQPPRSAVGSPNLC